MRDSARQQDDDWLVLRAQSGDGESLDALLRLLQEPLFRYVQRMAGADEALDILQETLLRICRKLQWLREPALLRPWAYRIASREVFRHLKRHRRFFPIDEQELAGVAAECNEAYGADLIASVPSLIEEVPPASRAVIVLFYLHELSLPQVAEVLDIPVGTVKSRLAYGLAFLRRSMSTAKGSSP